MGDLDPEVETAVKFSPRKSTIMAGLEKQTIEPGRRGDRGVDLKTSKASCIFALPRQAAPRSNEPIVSEVKA
ncbi:MAG: hypothetical protein WAK01_12370 [Methylocystis sp.]